MKKKIHTVTIEMNKKNINKIFEYFIINSGMPLEYVAGMINMMKCFGITMYRMGDEWVMEDDKGNELGRKVIDTEGNI